MKHLIILLVGLSLSMLTIGCGGSSNKAPTVTPGGGSLGDENYKLPPTNKLNKAHKQEALVFLIDFANLLGAVGSDNSVNGSNPITTSNELGRHLRQVCEFVETNHNNGQTFSSSITAKDRWGQKCPILFNQKFNGSISGTASGFTINANMGMNYQWIDLQTALTSLWKLNLSGSLKGAGLANNSDEITSQSFFLDQKGSVSYFAYSQPLNIILQAKTQIDSTSGVPVGKSGAALGVNLPSIGWAILMVETETLPSGEQRTTVTLNNEPIDPGTIPQPNLNSIVQLFE